MCVFLIIACFCFSSTNGLVWPEGGSKILVITGFGVPVDLQRETLIVGSVIKGNYRLPMNTSYLMNNLITLKRRKKSISRWQMYDILSRLMEMRGLSGKPCILRTICEIAQNPLAKNCGLFYELLTAFFRPTSTKEKVKKHSDNEYYAAQHLGNSNADCEQIFSDCKTNFIDLFTTPE